MHELDIILTLTGALTAALVLGLVAHKLRLSPIVGYLAAGVAVGPFTPGFVAQEGVARQFAELGIVLLMFGVGSNLHVRELLAVKRVAVPGAALGMIAATIAGALIGHSVVYGLALAVTSTVVLLRVFADAELLHRPVGHVAVGWLLVEDLFVVLVVVLMPAVSASGASLGSLGYAAIALAKVGGLVAFTLVVGRKTIPWLLAHVARTRSRELFTLAVLVMALGIAVGASKLFGASMALGAFLAGLVVGQSQFAARAASDALPMRDAFAVLFFVATGMLVDPHRIIGELPLTLATVLVVLVVKPAVAFAVMKVAGRPSADAARTAAGLGQIGEFSFVLGALGLQLGLLDGAAVQALVLTSIVTITANPALVRLAGRVAKSSDDDEGRRALVEYRAIVVGYGPVGRSLTRLLVEQGVEPTVIEMNDVTAEELRRGRLPIVVGDAARPEVLERAGVASAASLFFTASSDAENAVRAARALNPTMLIMARTAYVRDAGALERAGATTVVSAEPEIAIAFAERMLERLGASAEQIDRARDHVRRDAEQAS